MGFIKNTFNVKKLTTDLRRKKDLSERKHIPRGRDFGGFSAEDLSPYIFERLYLPILRHDSIPLTGLDMGRVTFDDIRLLANVLDCSAVHEYVKLGDVFSSLRPAASARMSFI
jgi:hypothetical protein